MGSLSSYNRGVEYLLCLKDVFTNYPWVKPLKDKTAKTALHIFHEIINKSKSKPNKLWIGQGRESYNNLMQKCLYNNDMLMYSSHNEGK